VCLTDPLACVHRACRLMDGSIRWACARSSRYLRAMFKLAGLQVMVQQRQQGFPTDLFPVLMFAMQ
jgi:hypothetical protein